MEKLYRVSKNTRPGADCGSDHDLLIAKFRLKLKKVMTNLDSILKKQRYYFANKGPSSQGYGFSCGHVWM